MSVTCNPCCDCSPNHKIPWRANIKVAAPCRASTPNVDVTCRKHPRTLHIIVSFELAVLGHRRRPRRRHAAAGACELRRALAAARRACNKADSAAHAL